MSPLASVRWRELRRSAGPPEIRIQLLGTFTLDTLVPHLGVALAEWGIIAEIGVGPYHQIVQECAGPDSETARFNPDVLVVWPRLEELGDGVDEVVTAIGSAPGQPVVVLPATPSDRPLGAGDAFSPSGMVATAARIREHARARLAGDAVAMCDADDIMRGVGESTAYDRRMEVLAGLPYTDRFLAAAGAALARTIRLAIRPANKGIVLDADGTLWGGVVGELGADGVDLGPGAGQAYLDFQRFLLELRADGVLLALCSKNTEADVWAAFKRPELHLRPEHLSAWRIDWRPKHVGIAEIADELGVGVDSLVLVDDNPAELAEVRAALPGLSAVLMPADPVRWRDMLHTGAFDRRPPTADDRARPLRMSQDCDRERLRRLVSPEEYLADLDIWVRVLRPGRADLHRLAQLVLKTNQMNLNGNRLSEPELDRLCRSGDHEVRMFEAGDRFGDYGQVGSYVLAFGARSARLHLFLLSCRAMGRGIERSMVADAFDVAARRGVERIMATTAETQRNEPCRTFFASIGVSRAGQVCALDRVEHPRYVTLRVHDE